MKIALTFITLGLSLVMAYICNISFSNIGFGVLYLFGAIILPGTAIASAVMKGEEKDQLSFWSVSFIGAFAMITGGYFLHLKFPYAALNYIPVLPVLLLIFPGVRRCCAGYLAAILQKMREIPALPFLLLLILIITKVVLYTEFVSTDDNNVHVESHRVAHAYLIQHYEDGFPMYLDVIVDGQQQKKYFGYNPIFHFTGLNFCLLTGKHAYDFVMTIKPVIFIGVLSIILLAIFNRFSKNHWLWVYGLAFAFLVPDLYNKTSMYNFLSTASSWYHPQLMGNVMFLSILFFFMRIRTGPALTAFWLLGIFMLIPSRIFFGIGFLGALLLLFFLQLVLRKYWQALPKIKFWQVAAAFVLVASSYCIFFKYDPLNTGVDISQFFYLSPFRNFMGMPEVLEFTRHMQFFQELAGNKYAEIILYPLAAVFILPVWVLLYFNITLFGPALLYVGVKSKRVDLVDIVLCSTILTVFILLVPFYYKSSFHVLMQVSLVSSFVLFIKKLADFSVFESIKEKYQAYKAESSLTLKGQNLFVVCAMAGILLVPFTATVKHFISVMNFEYLIVTYNGSKLRKWSKAYLSADRYNALENYLSASKLPTPFMAPEYYSLLSAVREIPDQRGKLVLPLLPRRYFIGIRDTELSGHYPYFQGINSDAGYLMHIKPVLDEVKQSGVLPEKFSHTIVIVLNDLVASLEEKSDMKVIAKNSQLSALVKR